MGRKSKDAKEKKLKRKQERQAEDALIAQKQKLVSVANDLEDPMQAFEPFKKYERNGLKLSISCEQVNKLDAQTVEWIFGLTKENMEALYQECGGWSDKDKRQELTEDAARYLLATDESGQCVAFVHFRFDMDEGDAVLYCYEIQLIKSVQRKGLGKFLMQILELMAHKQNMEKVMLTVFKVNTAGKDFFQKTMNYKVDETSPEDTVADAVYEEEGYYTYEILSKIMPQKKKPLTQSNQNH